LRWEGIEDFQKLTFGILAPRDLEELLDVGGFGGHLDRIRKNGAIQDSSPRCIRRGRFGSKSHSLGRSKLDVGLNWA
jgi:hypothetical protein